MVCFASQSRGSPLFMLFEEVPLSSSRDALIEHVDNARGSRNRVYTTHVLYTCDADVPIAYTIRIRDVDVPIAYTRYVDVPTAYTIVYVIRGRTDSVHDGIRETWNRRLRPR